ncbi:hypothetical protein KYI13_00160 [Macrococcoides bohemicum]|uniref:STM4504/CBY_0614 family protein n=1 Tax=Macrococcoides bohemicum TaxID=1903056 RepID=UPI001C5FA250|nr:hypothetical protein [Macrococcus bohemicus]QYA44795.1 hypothetical protein KYI13_00160 [Macrococcus bohemicus]
MFELFSKRTNPPTYDVYIFDEIPQKLRVQIMYAWDEFFNTDEYKLLKNNFQYQIFESINKIMCKEHGLLKLSRGHSYLERCKNFLLEEKDTNKIIDIIELSLRMFENIEKNSVSYLRDANIKYTSSEFIDDVNNRFRENGVGYEYINGQFIKKDSEFLYKNAIKPALLLFNEVDFFGAEEEFLEAFTHYKDGKNKEAIIAANKAFESTLKSICENKGWEVKGKKVASNLIKTVFENNLIPNYMQTHVNSLKTTLEGLPTIRNNESGHGQGLKKSYVSDYLTSYCLNLCAVNITMLINAYKNSDSI